MDLGGKHEFLSAYLKYVDNTETPKICHIWSVLAGVSACLGRRCWLDSGVENIWPNMYVVLSGPPGGRKSSAIRYVRDLLKQTTTIRFAPDDTGGQRQGLIKAMTDTGEEDEEEEVKDTLLELLNNETAEAATLTGLMNGHASKTLDALHNIQFDQRDPRTMWICASELKSFIGENNAQMLTFLLKMWDGDYYKYELRNSTYEIKDGLLGILGATTPSEIATMLPAGAMGSGFTSRIIFVHATGRNQRIPRPSLDAKFRDYLADIFGKLFTSFSGPFTESASAARTFDHIYGRSTSLRDPRFMSYCERRHTHLQKVAISLAASRGHMEISGEDYHLADHLLSMAEADMPDALGEYGMNLSSLAKSKLLEFVVGLTEPMSTTALYYVFSRDMKRVDFENALTELHVGKKITVFNFEGKQSVLGVAETPGKKAKKEMEQLKALLGEM